ncbi:hypothetical protein ACFOOK_16665 [Micromonospora krabiensis]|uniref:Integral membrane protein n=1 Tax=Micromonospora krabiensis TaxID=307121 RepID=A0A1C3N011_9ACTN|nr:hypothetical protein [Micromonospora krabiensis]SBV25922.1 hypothetical protein GA0070620_1404 [Micromonospora krabiensis]
MSDTSGSSSWPAPPGEVVELRVHGVSGAAAESVLDRPHAYQVAGDDSGGFYRPRPGYPDSTGPDGVVPEAYRWSDLPSGTAVRTLTLVFMLPFMLCNVALWMRPSGTTGERSVKAFGRALGLTLTALYVLSIVGVALDLVAWRCMGSPVCLADRDWLSWLGERPVGLRLAVLSLVPVAALGAIWWLGARPAKPFAAFRPPPPGDDAHRLGAIGQWDAGPFVGRLRSVHVAVGFGTLDASLLAARMSTDSSAPVVALAVLVGVLLVACLAVVCAHPMIDRPVAPGADRITRGLRTAACVLTPLVLAVILVDPAPWPQHDGLPRYGATVAGIFVAQTALLAAIAIFTMVQRQPRRPSSGRGMATTAAVATGLAVAFSSELVYRFADVLDRQAPTAEQIETSPPLAYKWAIFGFVVAVVSSLAAAGVVTLASRPARMRAGAAIVARDFPDAPPEAAPRLRQVQRTIARARFTDRLESLAMVYAALVAVGFATTILGLMGEHPAELIDSALPIPGEFVTFFIGLGSYVIGGILLALLIGGIFAYRTAEFRRYVGVIWDLGTFWPRAAHPFAPACYAERAVPELTKRITYLVGRGDAVLLSGHSHGSVLLAATVLQLPDGVGERVALLTYGSPLHRLYSRLFPAYVDDDVLREVGKRVGWRWINLWRDTDHIGGWVFSPHRPGDPDRPHDPAWAVDRRLVDPNGVVAPPSDSVPPQIHGHWPCESDERFVAAVRELTGRLRAGGG